jgi:hypothetical protein
MKRKIFRFTMRLFVRFGIAHKGTVMGLPCEEIYTELPW